MRHEIEVAEQQNKTEVVYEDGDDFLLICEREYPEKDSIVFVRLNRVEALIAALKEALKKSEG